MALTLSLTKSSQSRDLESLYISETTGDYNATTNPTGYGAPNSPATSDIYKSYIYIKKPTDTTYTTLEVNTTNVGVSAINFADAVSTAELQSDDMGSSSVAALTDGVYTFKYRVIFNTGNIVNAVTLTTITIDTADAAFEPQYLYIPDLDQTYTITDIDLGTGEITVSEAVDPLVDGLDYYIVFEQDLIRMLINGAAQKCIVENIPALLDACCDDCGESSDILQVWKLFAYGQIGPEAAFNCENYTKAQKMLDLETRLCSSTNNCSSCS